MTCQCSSNTNSPMGGGNTGTNTGFLMMGGSGGRKKSRVRRKMRKSIYCNGNYKCKCKMCKNTRRRKRIRACTKKRCRRNNCTRRCSSGKGKNKRNKNMKGGGPSILGDLSTNPSYFMHKLVGTPYETPVNNISPTGYYV